MLPESYLLFSRFGISSITCVRDLTPSRVAARETLDPDGTEPRAGNHMQSLGRRKIVFKSKMLFCPHSKDEDNWEWAAFS